MNDFYMKSNRSSTNASVKAKKLFKQVSAGLLLTLGGLCLVAGVYAPFNHQIDRKEQMSEAMACLLFGLPLTGVGGWIALGLYQQTQEENRTRLQSIFYNLLKNHNGRITVLQFAMEARLSGEVAKHYLDAQAREFNANFDVSQEGEVFYCFSIGELDNHRLAESSAAVLTTAKRKKRRKRKRGHH
ncbi:MAG TPA: hypothetical protein V6D50_03850 [Chroococcales cyanobacterium]